MIPIQSLNDADLEPLLQRAVPAGQEVAMAVEGIDMLIQRDGDQALRELTKRLDGVKLKFLFLPDAVWDELAQACPADVKAAIDDNLGRIRAFHELQGGAEQTLEQDGIQLGRRAIPYERVACYVPGGRANYPSSVLMTVTPAVIAGVPEIIVATPPNRESKIAPEVAYAAKAAGAHKILLAGGAQAVFALAYGTDSVPSVRAIVGPGNAYVTAAKQRVASHVHIDSPAGPSELLILADDTAPATAVAWDLIAQAEHDPDARVVLVTTSQSLAEAVVVALEARVPNATRTDIIEKSLQHAAILVADTLDDCIVFANAYAAEHLEIMTQDDDAVLGQIQHAGSVFLGSNTPVSLGDYGSGTNHVLPTMGYAAMRGGLAVDDFRKWITWQRASQEGLASVANAVTTLARAEGLDGHAEAVERRLT